MSLIAFISNDSMILSTSGEIYPCMGFYDDDCYEINDDQSLFQTSVSTLKCKDCKYENIA